MDAQGKEREDRMRRAAIKFTVADYNALPEQPRYELIEGEFYMTPSPSSDHQRVAKRIVSALTEWESRTKLGEVYFAPLDVILSNESVVQPDIIVILNRNRHIVQEKVTGPPDVVVEILSPATLARDLTLKRRLYYRHGVAEYWVVDPARRTVEVNRWTEGDFSVYQTFAYSDTLVSPLLAGFSVPLRTLFD